MIDHITFHLTAAAIESPELAEFMALLALEEVEPNDHFEHGYRVRWFEQVDWGLANRREPVVHCVADGRSGRVEPGLGHFCVRLGQDGYDRARASRFCARDSGSGRAWLGYWPIRAEVRP